MLEKQKTLPVVREAPHANLHAFGPQRGGTASSHLNERQLLQNTSKVHSTTPNVMLKESFAH